MNRHFLLAILCTLTVLVTMTGCKKDAPKPATDQEAIERAGAILQELTDTAVNAGDNCTRMSNELYDLLEKKHEALRYGMSVDAKLSKDPNDTLWDKYLGEDSEFLKAATKCRNTPKMREIAHALQSFMLDSYANHITAAAPDADGEALSTDGEAPTTDGEAPPTDGAK